MLPRDAAASAANGAEWGPGCNGYGSSLMEESERCTRCGSGLVLVVESELQAANGRDRGRQEQRETACARPGGGWPLCGGKLPVLRRVL